MKSVKDLYPWIETDTGTLVRAMRDGEQPYVPGRNVVSDGYVANGLLYAKNKSEARQFDAVFRIVPPAKDGGDYVVRDQFGRTWPGGKTKREALKKMEELQQW